MTAKQTESLNKIRLGGMSADLEGYAIELNTSGPQPQAYLWYLSMVGHITSVQAIWAGLVNTPPQNVELYCENSNPATADYDLEQTQVSPSAITVQLAESHRSGGWQFTKSQLPKASTYQGELIPHGAFHNLSMVKNSQEAANSTRECEGFLLLQPPTLTAYLRKLTSTALPLWQAETITLREMQNLYFTRLNSLINFPLHPKWTEKLWQRAIANGEIARLEGAGVEAYLCKKPPEVILRQEITAMIQCGKLAC